MWDWIAGNWIAFVALVLSLDAERRLYFTTDWSLSKTAGDGWMLRNEGWLAERDIRVEPLGGAHVSYRGPRRLRRHESATIVVSMVEASRSRDVRVSSRRLLLRHSLDLSL